MNNDIMNKKYTLLYLSYSKQKYKYLTTLQLRPSLPQRVHLHTHGAQRHHRFWFELNKSPSDGAWIVLPAMI
jgi:hypothetical protein